MIAVSIAAIAFVVLMFVAKGIARRSLLALSTDEKARLVDLAAGTSRVWSVAFLALIGLWVASAYRLRSTFPYATVGVLVGMLLLSSTAAYSTYGRLRIAGMPSSYLRDFWVARSLVLAGALLLFAALGAYILAV
jgi:hypothetical protein